MENAGSWVVVILMSVWVFSPPILAFLVWKQRKKVEAAKQEAHAAYVSVEEARAEVATIKEHFAPVTDIKAEVAKMGAVKQGIEDNIANLRATYAEKRPILDELKHQLAIYDERLSFVEMGVYEPHFEFTDSESFKLAIREVRGFQKLMVSEKTAVHIPTSWFVNGSAAQGKTMVNRQVRLSLRAFNNECEAAISNARWNNVNAMEARILRSAQAVNKANDSMGVQISDDYVKLKLRELYLTHEYREKQKAEKEERAELARAEREEKRLLAEAAKAEREEQQYEELLNKARLEVAGGVDTEAMRQRIAVLEASLAEAHERKERAQAMAEMTKSGFVYIISNIGSFGEEVVKIGLTRRLNPDDRVKELGDASVPFAFDCHAMIYSDEAPTLENALHSEFADRRINMSNMRKEFFRVGLDEVEAAVGRLAPQASFFRDREAQEWHETLARRSQLIELERKAVEEAGAVLPDSI